MNPPDYVASVVAFAFGLAASSFFPAIVMGIFSLNMNKRALTRIRNLVQARDTSGDKSALDIIARELESEASGRVSQWRRIDEICLRVGYFLLLGAAILRIFA